MIMKTYKIGLIGFGFIGKVHAQAYRSLPYCLADPPALARVMAVLRNDPSKDKELLETLAVPICTNDEHLFWSQELDAIDICSPNASHYEYCLKAIQKKIPIYCEKPLTKTIEDARELAKLVREQEIPTHTAFTYRFLPAVGLAKDLIAAGWLGEIHHFQSRLFHSSYLNPQRPISWRLQEDIAGGGALTDLGIHFLDLIRNLLGDVEWLQCQAETFIKSRPRQDDPNSYEEVCVDDWALCTMQLQNGGIGSLEVSRVAGGAGNIACLEIFGSRGSIKIDFNQSETIQYYDVKKDQWISSAVLPEGITPRHFDRSRWSENKRSLGRFLSAHIAVISTFLDCLENQIPSQADFQTALKAQELLHACYQSAREDGKRVFIHDQ